MTQQRHDLEEILLSCNRCGLCHGCSPLFELKKLESATARGKIRLARSLMQGELEPSETLVDRIYECLMCGHCSSMCPAGIKVEEVIHSTRRFLASSGKVPRAVKSLVSRIDLSGNIYGRNIGGIRLREGELVYFPGCVSSIEHPELADATLICLIKSGLKVSILNGICCGAPAWAAGFAEVYGKSMEKLQSILEGREVVTSCPQCYHFLRLNQIQARHTAQVYAELLEREKLRLRPIKGTFTYSDPCYLTRFSNIMDEPRVVMEYIPRLRLLEMRSNKMNTRCCGNGLEVVQVSNPNLAAEVALRRLEEAIDIRAGNIVTSCPHCYLTLKKTMREKSLPMAIKDLSQLLADALFRRSSKVSYDRLASLERITAKPMAAHT